MEKPAQDASQKFLLLVGMARSGTSWIGKIFDSHPLTLYKHEPDRTLPGVPLYPRMDDANTLVGPVRTFCRKLSSIEASHVAGSLPVFQKVYRSRLAQRVHAGSVLNALAAERIGLKLPIWQCISSNRVQPYIVWKSIDSLGRLGTILRIMEACRAIRITRHPCASISSTLRGEAQHKFSSSVRASEDFQAMGMLLESSVHERRLSIDHLRRLQPVERLAWIWVLANEKATQESQATGRCKDLRYEDVCRNPITKSKEIFAFAGLQWDDQSANFIRASTLGEPIGKFDQLTQSSNRYYGIFRNPVESAGKWKTEMKDEDIQRVYKVLRQSDLIRLYPESESTAVATV